MGVKLAKNGTWLAQFRCKDKFGNEVHKCKRGFATAEEAQVWGGASSSQAQAAPWR